MQLPKREDCEFFEGPDIAVCFERGGDEDQIVGTGRNRFAAYTNLILQYKLEEINNILKEQELEDNDESS